MGRRGVAATTLNRRRRRLSHLRQIATQPHACGSPWRSAIRRGEHRVAATTQATAHRRFEALNVKRALAAAALFVGQQRAICVMAIQRMLDPYA